MEKPLNFYNRPSQFLMIVHLFLQNMNEKCINFKLAISIEVLLLEKIDNVSQFSLNCIQYLLSLTYAMKELIATRYGFI